MKKLVFAILAFVAFSATAQTQVVNDPNAKPRTLSGEFSAVSVATGIELFLTQGNEVSLAVSSNDEKYLEDFKTEVENGVLKIYFTNGGKTRWEKGRKLKAYLSVKMLNKLSASSGASVQIMNTFTAGTFDLRMSSGAELKGEIKASELTVDQSSGSEVDIKGSAPVVNIEVSSGASFSGFDFVSDKGTVRASSGAEIKVTVNKELDPSASSGGSIRYKGDAKMNGDAKSNSSSGGSIRKA